MIYLHTSILGPIYILPTYLPTYQLSTYFSSLHIRTICIPCQITVPYNLLNFTNTAILHQPYRHNGVLVISTTEHQEFDLQTKIDIYLVGLPTRLRGSEITTFSKDLQ
jgi:hypothetical protein